MSQEDIPLQITVLGSGTSTGVPTIGCECAVCQSTNSKNKRTRSSVLIEKKTSGEKLVIDTTPDFRSQILREGVKMIDGVLYTHTHADHCHGFDDLRPFYFKSQSSLDCWISHEHVGELKERFSYAFNDTGYVGTKPEVKLNLFSEGHFQAIGLEVETYRLPHGNVFSYCFRFGRFVYATDFKQFPKEVIEKWHGKIDLMIASGLRKRKHPTHSCISETIEVFKRLRVKRGIITHLSHEIEHIEDSKELPAGVEFAFDGMRVDL